MATLKLSAIAAAGAAPASTDQVVGVTGGNTDNLFSLTQIAKAAAPLLTAATITSGATEAASALTIMGQTGVLAASQPLLNMTQTWNAAGVTFTGIKLNVTNTASAAGSLLADFQVGGVSQAKIDKAGNITALGTIQTSTQFNVGTSGNQTLLAGDTTNGITIQAGNSGQRSVSITNLGFAIPSTSYFGIASTTDPRIQSATVDVFLSRFGVGTLGLSDNTTITEWQQYVTTDSTTAPTNYARAVSRFTNNGTAADTWLLGTEKGGSGTSPSKFQVNVAGVKVFDYNVSTPSAFTFTATNVIATPNSQFQAKFFQLDDGAGTARSFLSSAADGNIKISNAAGTSFGLLQLGGVTSSFPAIKRNSAILAVRLADDSADAAISASTAIFSTLANVATTSAVCYNTGTGVLTYDGTIGTCTVSAAKYKDNFNIIPDRQALDMVLAMKPKSWNYKGEPDRNRIGLVADDLLEVDERLVGFDSEGEVANDNYWAVITLLVGAVKEQQIMLEELMAA